MWWEIAYGMFVTMVGMFIIIFSIVSEIPKKTPGSSFITIENKFDIVARKITNASYADSKEDVVGLFIEEEGK